MIPSDDASAVAVWCWLGVRRRHNSPSQAADEGHCRPSQDKERTMKSATLVAGLLVSVVQLAVAQNQQFVGTWKVDVAKSRYQPGPGPRSEILRFEPAGEGFKVSLDGVNEQGPYHSEGTGKFDGMDVPVVATPARQARFTYAFSRIDDHTWDIVIKVNGERRILVHNVVSDDGKTMRGVSSAVTNQGLNTSQVVIYDKQ
jgi:hypothetical protein